LSAGGCTRSKTGGPVDEIEERELIADPICIGCGKTPDELSEYSPRSTGMDLTPDEYVWQEEGTLNPSNGHFLCDSCYIRAGMPTAPEGWIAP
jgi:hypothetical protein